jgi:hypothetical protein
VANLRFCFGAKYQILALAKKILKSTCQKKAISGITDKRVNTASKTVNNLSGVWRNGRRYGLKRIEP